MESKVPFGTKGKVMQVPGLCLSGNLPFDDPVLETSMGPGGFPILLDSALLITGTRKVNLATPLGQELRESQTISLQQGKETGRSGDY